MKNLFLMTEEQIETLAAERTIGQVAIDGLDGTYLRALVVGVQARLGPKRGKRPSVETQLDAIDIIAGPFYAAVLRGVTTRDIELSATLAPDEVTKRTRERNRRATFARTIKSTLVTWVKTGGDIRALDVGKVTKSELRAQVVAASQGAPTVSRIEAAQSTILALVAREGPDEAREHLERVILALQAALDEIPATEAHHGSTTVLRARETEGATFRGHVRRMPAAERRAGAT